MESVGEFRYRPGGNAITDNRDVCEMNSSTEINRVICRAATSEDAQWIADSLNAASEAGKSHL